MRRPDGMLFAKSSDRPIDEAQVLRWFDRRAASPTPMEVTHTTIEARGAAGVLGSQPTWMWGLEHGLNEHGVAVGNEKIWTIDDPHNAPPALIGMDLVRLGLERGATADAAVEALADALGTIGQGGSGEADHDEPYWSSFLLVDAHGGWVVETSGRTWVAQPIGEGAAISNRVTLSTGWTRSSDDVAPGIDWDAWRAPEAPTGIADHRLTATRACVAKGNVATAQDAVAALRHHGTVPWGAPGATDAPVPPPEDVRDDWSGVTVCMHIRGYQCTTASMVAELPVDPEAPIRLWASLGTPCTGVFVPVAMFRATGGAPPSVAVPALLSDERAWQSFAALSRRVEAPGDEGADALEAIRDVFGPLEAALWEEADQLWSTRGEPAIWSQATTRWDAQLRSALARLS